MQRTLLHFRLLPSLFLSAFLMVGSLSSCGSQNDQEPMVRQTLAKESAPLDSSTRPQSHSKEKAKQKKPIKVVSYGKNEPVTI